MNCPSCEHDNIPGEDLCEHCGLDLAGLDVAAWGVDPEDPVLKRPLGELKLKQPLTVGFDATAAVAIERMRTRREGCIFVVDATGALVGVVTERDVCARLVARHRDPTQTPVLELMTPRPVTLRSGDPLAWALHRMGVDGHRHLPVLDDRELVGFLSIRTVLEAFGN